MEVKNNYMEQYVSIYAILHRRLLLKDDGKPYVTYKSIADWVKTRGIEKTERGRKVFCVPVTEIDKHNDKVVRKMMIDMEE